MPFVNGRFYMNPIYGAAVERARSTDSDPDLKNAVLRPGTLEDAGQFGDLVARPGDTYRAESPPGFWEEEANLEPKFQSVSAQKHHRSSQHPGHAAHHAPQHHTAQKSTHLQAHPHVTVYPHETKIGGTASWRNNNPANITYGPFAKAHGAIGSDHGGMAIFPTIQAGQNAQDALWETKTYQSLTIEQAGKRWTHHDPPNVQKAYVAALSKGADAPPDTPVWYLSPDQLEWLKKAQTHQEGFQAGITEPVHHVP